MKTGECPKCNGREVYEIDRVCFEASDSINGVVSLDLFAHYGPSGELGWLGEKNKRVGLRASARVCGGCGHTELFTKDLELLQQLAAQGHVRRIR